MISPTPRVDLVEKTVIVSQSRSFLVPVTGLDLIMVLPPQDKRHLIPKRSIPEGMLLFGS
jgi:hypothetical protein